MSKEIMEMLNKNEKARKLKQEFESYVKESDLTEKEIEEERKTMIMLAMTFVPQTIKIMAKEVYQEINK